MRTRIAIRSLLLLVGFCAFGVLDALVKGHHGGLRNVVGNVSAPWAMVPLVAGAFVLPRRPLIGALAGVVSSVATLASYTAVRAGGFDLTGNGATESLANRWLIAGVVGGVALGALATLLARRGWNGVLVAIMAGLLLLEPAGRLLWAATKNDPLRTYVPYPSVWVAEIAVGVGLLAWGCWFGVRAARS